MARFLPTVLYVLRAEAELRVSCVFCSQQATHEQQSCVRRPLLVCIGMKQHSDAGIRSVIRQMLEHPVW